MNQYMKGYKFDTWQDFFISLFPSLKEGLMNLAMIGSLINATCVYLFGLDLLIVVVLVIGFVTELGSGMYASIYIKEESPESGKFGRFCMKLILFIVAIFMSHQLWQFYREDIVLGVFFGWMKYFIITLTIAELMMSILENYAVIDGKEKDYYSKYIKAKIDSLFNKQS